MSQRVEDMLACNNLNWRWMKLYYAIKDQLLRRDGQFDGFDLQQWYDERAVWVDHQQEKEAYAIHTHLLMRYWLDEHLFHMPSDEFDYCNYAMNVGKISPHFKEMRDLAQQNIIGKKRTDYSRQSEAWQALKRLVKEYGNLVRKSK